MNSEIIKVLKIYGQNLKQIRKQYLRKIEKGEAYRLTTGKILVIVRVLETSPILFLDGV